MSYTLYLTNEERLLINSALYELEQELTDQATVKGVESKYQKECLDKRDKVYKLRRRLLDLSTLKTY